LDQFVVRKAARAKETGIGRQESRKLNPFDEQF